ncbi:MAG: kelch repeat-containing protein [bacterium]
MCWATWWRASRRRAAPSPSIRRRASGGSGPPPSGRVRGAAGVAVVDGQIYLVGGLGGGRAVALVDRYDPVADAWTALPDLPTPRDHMAAGAVAGRVVIAGGREADIDSHVARVDVFDPATGRWATASPMPTSRGGTAAAVLDGWLYVIGGEGNRAAPSGVFSAVEAWEAATDRWVVLPAMPNPRHGMAAAALDGRIYVPGRLAAGVRRRVDGRGHRALTRFCLNINLFGVEAGDEPQQQHQAPAAARVPWQPASSPSEATAVQP